MPTASCVTPCQVPQAPRPHLRLTARGSTPPSAPLRSACTASCAASAKSASAVLCFAGCSAHRSRAAPSASPPARPAPARLGPEAAALAAALRLGGGGCSTGRTLLAAATTSQRSGLRSRCLLRFVPLLTAAAPAVLRLCKTVGLQMPVCGEHNVLAFPGRPAVLCLLLQVAPFPHRSSAEGRLSA